LISQFKPVNSSKVARDKLAGMRQFGSVSKYNFEFTALCLEIDDISESEKLDRYIRGLKYSIKEKVELEEPTTLAEAMSKAQRIDSITYYSRHGSSSSSGNKYSGGSNSYKPMELGAVEESSSGDGDVDEASNDSGDQLNAVSSGRKPISRAQQLSREEFARCMKNKLCLRCKKPGHISRNCKVSSNHAGKGRAQ
jgi:hypothetical protein